MNHDDPDADHGARLRHTLNLETGKLSWRELQRHFARGAVIVVARELDLIDVAVAFAQDDQAQTKAWIAGAQVVQASDADARRWQQHNSIFWSLVVAPWVLVQELDAEASAGA
ncbi:MAG: DUF2288 domain-containing protein [Gammaproteobacteria bacterium]|nr:DUF2288 domain-containing protein [Gammaproteobacteria bacterium]